MTARGEGLAVLFFSLLFSFFIFLIINDIQLLVLGYDFWGGEPLGNAALETD